MNLTKEIIENKAARPAFINEFEGSDAEGNTVTKYGVRLTKMEDGQSVTLKLTADPKQSPQVEGKFGISNLVFFEASDGTPLSILVNPKSKSAGRVGPLVKGQPAPAGKTLLARLQEFNEGDIVKISLEVKKMREKTDTWRCFTVSPVAAFQ